MMLFITGMGSQISAASLENVLKAPKAAAGKLVTDKKGVRYYNSGSKTFYFIKNDALTMIIDDVKKVYEIL